MILKNRQIHLPRRDDFPKFRNGSLSLSSFQIFRNDATNRRVIQGIRPFWIDNHRVVCDAVMEPFAREVLAKAAQAGGVVLIMDQAKTSDRSQILMLSLRFSECAVRLASWVEATAGAIGFGSIFGCEILILLKINNNTATIIYLTFFALESLQTYFIKEIRYKSYQQSPESCHHDS